MMSLKDVLNYREKPETRDEYFLIMKVCLAILGGNVLYYYFQNAIWEALKLSADLTVYYAAGQAVWNGTPEQLYKFEYYYDIAKARGPYNYPPFFAVLFSPLTIFPYKTIVYFWLLMNNLILLFGCVIVWYETKHLNLLVLTIFLLICCFFGPLIANTHWANINAVIWISSLLGWWLYKQKKPYLCAFFLAFGTIIKLAPIMLIGYFLIKREYRIFFASILMLVLMVGLSSIFIGGLEQYIVFFKVQTVLLGAGLGKGGTPMDQSVVGFFKHLASQGFVGTNMVHPLGYFVNFSILVATFLMCRFRPIEPSDRTFDLEYGLVASLPLLSSTMIVTTTHFTILLTTYLLLLYYLVVSKKEIPFLLYIALGISYALVSFGAFGGQAFSHGIMILFQSPKLYGTLMLWGICMYLLYQERFGQPVPIASSSPALARNLPDE